MNSINTMMVAMTVMAFSGQAEICINEIMADNGGSYSNADGNASDWIELYNAGETDADISGWRLCDDLEKKWKKWEELPEGTTIPAGGRLIVWADDFTGWTNGEVHVNLGFSAKGEAVALARSEGEIVDSFAFGPQYTDVSFGRDPSNPAKFVYFRTPTPGAANGNDGIENGDCFNISINEMMAENGGKFPNAAGEAMDWVELYNAGAADVNVSGWGFQDDPTKGWSKWKTLPEGAVVPAGGYLLVWGDNKDFYSFTGITNGEVHVNMGLSKKGEGLHLALTNGVGTVVKIDGVDFPAQFSDVSYGRDSSDTAKWLFFTNATPGAANGADGLLKYPPEEEQGGEEDPADGPREGEFAVLLDVSRPVAGKAMKATVTGEREGKVSFAWSVREPTGEYGDVICEGREYAPTAADYEHWIRVVATDGAGRSASREFYFSKLPIVYIDTDDGQPVTVKTEYKGAAIRIQGNEEFGEQFDGRTEIKGRGNSSWGFPKKPYKLKLEKKTDLFGFGKNKHWVLISNWLDVCGMRNWMASTLAKELGIVGMDMTWVQVVLNGSYEGTYMLCEHIRVGADRVDIFDWSDTIESDGHAEEDLAWLDAEAGVDFSGGYIFELDNRYDEVSKFTTANGLKVMFNTPEFACTSQKMMEYAQGLWADYDASVRAEDGYTTGGEHYSQIVDIDSMVSFWLVNQVLGNSDSTSFSRYAYKDCGKILTFGPAWDFDVSVHSMKRPYRGADPTAWVFQYYDSDSNLFREWADDPLFCLKSVEVYQDRVRPWLVNLLDGGVFDARIAYQREAGEMNDRRWDREGQYAEPDDMQHPRSFNGELGDAAVVRDFLVRRLEWLDEQCASVDRMVRSVYVDHSASPYVKDDETLAVVLVNGKDAASWDASTDFVLNKGEKSPQVRVSVSKGAIAKLHAYVNGLRYGVYDVTDGKCEFSVSAEKLVATWGHRDMVSLIAKDATGNTIARNYLTILSNDTPEIVGDEDAAVSGDPVNGFVIQPSARKTEVEVVIPKGVDVGLVTVAVSPSVARVKPNGAKVKIVNAGQDITPFLALPEANESGDIELARAVVKESVVREAVDAAAGAIVDLDATSPEITTAPTKVGLLYTFSEGRTIGGLTESARMTGNGKKWTPTVNVKGGSAAFYSIGVSKGNNAVDLVDSFVGKPLNNSPSKPWGSNVMSVSDTRPVVIEGEVYGVGLEEYCKNAILCQVEFRDKSGKVLMASNLSHNDNYGDWFYIGANSGEFPFKKEITPPEGAQTLSLKLCQFWKTYDLMIKRFEVIH